jgi:hypothetical protein
MAFLPFHMAGWLHRSVVSTKDTRQEHSLHSEISEKQTTQPGFDIDLLLIC